MNKEERLDYLDSERVKIWARITELTESVNKKTSDYESEAKLSAEKASESEILSNIILEKIQIDLNQAETKLTTLNGSYNLFEETFNRIQTSDSTAKTQLQNINLISTTITSKSVIIQSQIAEIERIFANKPV